MAIIAVNLTLDTIYNADGSIVGNRTITGDESLINFTNTQFKADNPDGGEIYLNSDLVSVKGDGGFNLSNPTAQQNLVFNDAVSGFSTFVKNLANTAERTQTLQDASGTIALLSDITAHNPLATDNQVITDATRTITLAGTAITDTLNIQNDALVVSGSGEVGMGVAPNANYKTYIKTTSHSRGLYITSSADSGIAFFARENATSGTNTGFKTECTGVGATTNYAGRFEASGATTNYAIDIVSGDIKFSQATQTMELNGTAITDTLNIQNNTLIVSGSGNIGIGITPASAIKTLIGGNLTTILQSISTSTSGSTQAIEGKAIGVGGFKHTALKVEASGATNNYAIEIIAGDIKTTGGNGLSATYTFGGGGSGDIASMTYTVGILTAVTTVP